ncbi:MAG: beta-lactamase-like [bacterium]|nr:MAG: beta-lactamase-like [bacterium]
MRKLLIFLLVLFSSLTLIQAQTKTPESNIFTVQEVAPQVWALIVKPTSNVQAISNTAFFTVGDRVAIVDSHFTPAAAREAARLVKIVTGNKPIHYLINTHWHPDHVQGNSTYSSFFPQALDVIAHVNTRRDIQEKEILSLMETQEELTKETKDLQEQLKKGKDEKGVDLTTEKRQETEKNLQQTKDLQLDLENLEITLPNVTFDKSLFLHGGDREVQVLYFGRGHTEGDVVVFLPKENVLITGDLLTGSLPFTRDGYPQDWGQTLAGVEKLNVSRVIPGHGQVQEGKERIIFLKEFMFDMVTAVKEQIAAGKSKEDTIKIVKVALSEKHAKKFSNFERASNSAIERAYTRLTEK